MVIDSYSAQAPKLALRYFNYMDIINIYVSSKEFAIAKALPLGKVTGQSL
jgi:hypothetical protein